MAGSSRPLNPPPPKLTEPQQ
ncbi:hypothetical protein EE612_019829 [Oryza sativa]|nr:hypothetical protein EE612_019829 [Oryza sativa]